MYKVIPSEHFMHRITKPLMREQYWMIGNEIGKDLGGVLNRGDSYCPEDSTQIWEYWNDWLEVCTFVNKQLSFCQKK